MEYFGLLWTLLDIGLLLFLGIIYLLFRSQKKIKNGATKSIEGTIIGYRYSNSAQVPLVEYVVGGKSYRQILRYNVVTIVSSPFHRIQADGDDDLLNTSIKIYKNSAFSYNRIFEEKFPKGTHLTVWYNPKEPEKSFVERYAGTYSAYKLGLIAVTILGTIINVLCVFVVLYSRG